MITVNELVQREVIQCVSTLFDVLLNAAAEGQLSDGTTHDELLDLTVCKDYEEAGEEHIRGMSRDDLISAFDDAGVKDERSEMEKGIAQEGASESELDEDDAAVMDWVGLSDDDLRKILRVYVDSEACGWEEFCDEYGVEPEVSETYEYWSVTDWLGRQLKDRGESVGRITGLTIWGRSTTGQMICMDEVIMAIHREMTK